MEAKFEHDLSSVCLNGSDGDSQLRCDLLVRFPLGQEMHDFTLARSYARACSFPLLMLATCAEKSFQHDFGYLRREEPLALRNGFHGSYQAECEIGFQKVPASAGVQCPAYHLV